MNAGVPACLDCTAPTRERAGRRADYGEIRLSRRDSYGLILAAEHYAVP